MCDTRLMKPKHFSKDRAQNRESGHKPARQREDAAPRQTHLLYGLHAVRQAWLNPDRTCRSLMMTDGAAESFADTLAEAKRLKLNRPAPTRTERDNLDRLLPGAVHQGIALDAAPLEAVDITELCRQAEMADNACIMILDQVTDPHNVGAILRSCAAFGALAVVMPERNAPQVTGVLAKTACGAADVVPLVRVNNLAHAMAELKEAGFWSIGLDESGEGLLSAIDLTGKIALVMGAEGEGLRRLTMENCDIIAKLPTQPPIGSLNVSNAAAVSLYEVRRRVVPAA